MGHKTTDEIINKFIANLKKDFRVDKNNFFWIKSKK